MIPKSGFRFSDKIMRQQKSMIPKSGFRFSDKIMRQQKSMIPKSGFRFSEKMMLTQRHQKRRADARRLTRHRGQTTACASHPRAQPAD
jgi:hypothetical protein